MEFGERFPIERIVFFWPIDRNPTNLFMNV
jgi:hypothetical protein